MKKLLSIISSISLISPITFNIISCETKDSSNTELDIVSIQAAVYDSLYMESYDSLEILNSSLNHLLKDDNFNFKDAISKFEANASSENKTDTCVKVILKEGFTLRSEDKDTFDLYYSLKIDAELEGVENNKITIKGGGHGKFNIINYDYFYKPDIISTDDDLLWCYNISSEVRYIAVSKPGTANISIKAKNVRPINITVTIN